MTARIAIVGAGISGLTTGVVLAERGYAPRLVAARPAEQSTSGAAAAIWYPYEAAPQDMAWALITYGRLLELQRDASSGVTLTEIRCFSRNDGIAPPSWASAIGYRMLAADELLPAYRSGFALPVPLMDGSLYLPWLRERLRTLGGALTLGVSIERLADVDAEVIVNCTGYGARSLAGDAGLEPHRGQSVVVEPLDAPTLAWAMVCEEAPLTYVIPRSVDCVLGGVNEVTDAEAVDPAATERIIAECSRALHPLLQSPPRWKESRVGLRPFRAAGVRLEAERLPDGRLLVHNYGHSGAGFTLSWGCAHRVAELIAAAMGIPSLRCGTSSSAPCSSS